MPFSPAQHRLFEARAHGAKFPMAEKIPIATAQKMAGEGIKSSSSPDPKRLGKALKAK